MKKAIAFLVLSLCIPATAAEKKYEICLFPRTCTGKPRRQDNGKKKENAKDKKAPKEKSLENTSKNVPESTFILGKDALSRAILQGRLTHEEEGIVSAVRLAPDAKDKEGRIIYSGTESLTLPPSKIPAGKDGAKGAADDEWITVEIEIESADQLNGMREERKSLKGGAGEAKSGSDRMWGEKKKKK